MNSTASSPRSRNKERTKAKLLEAAVDAFGRLGFEDIKIDGVAESAGLNKRLVYYYFDDKAGLFQAAKEQVISAINLWSDGMELERKDLNGLLAWAIDVFAEHPKLTHFLICNWERTIERNGLSHCRLYECLANRMISRSNPPSKLDPLSLFLATLQVSVMKLLAPSADDTTYRAARFRLAVLFLGALYDYSHLPSKE